MLVLQLGSFWRLNTIRLVRHTEPRKLALHTSDKLPAFDF